MHDVLRSNIQNPSQNFLHKLNNFEKPPKILQNTKLRLEKSEIHD